MASHWLLRDALSRYLALVTDYPQATDGERCRTRNITRQLRSLGVVTLFDLQSVPERCCLHHVELSGAGLGRDALDSDLA